MFWGLVLEPSKKYTQKVDQTFHISQAALDLKSSNGEPVQLVVEYDNSNFVLATLSKKANIFQVPLDLIFKSGDEISFRIIGNGKVHLSGYHVLEDIDSVIINGEEESDIEDEEKVVKGKGKRKKPSPNAKGGKKPKLDDTNEDESGDDDDDDNDDIVEEYELYDDSEGEIEQKITVKKKAKKNKQKAQSSLNMDDDEEEEEEEDESDEDENDDDEDEDDNDEDDVDEIEIDEIDDSDDLFFAGANNRNKGKMNKLGNKKASPTSNGLESSAKKKDKSQNLNKSQKLGTPKKDGKTPKSENKQKNEKKPGSLESTPQRKNSENLKKDVKTPKSPKSEGSPQKKVLEGGVISEEIKVGNGPVAKPGKMATVYYVGTLASTKKEFDSVQSGGGFKFRIGRNEVIKGWDIGINGMKVGGKRRLTIPPHLAYGSKGSAPVIPPNSTLIFTVELKGLS